MKSSFDPKLDHSELNAILASAMDAIIAIDQDQNVVLFNAAAEQMFGCSGEEALGESLDRFLPNRFREQHPGYIERFAASGVTKRQMGTLGEIWGLRSDGREFPIEASISVVSAGPRKLLSVILRDVTSKREAQANLKESRRALGSLVSSLPGIAFRSQNVAPWKMHFISQGCLELTGYSADEFLSGEVHFGNLIHPEDRSKVDLLVQKARDEGRYYSMTYRVFTKEGKMRWFAERGNEVPNPGGGETALEGIITDISDIKEAEAIQRVRSEALESLANGAPLREVLEVLTTGAESVFPELMCSILLMDTCGTRLRNGSSPSLSKAYVEAVDGLVIGPQVGSCGAAAYLGERVIVENIATHPNWEKYQDLAALSGVGSCWSQPILDTQGEVLGSFAMYHTSPCSPSTEELSFIQTTAHLAGIAIESHRINVLRRESERRFRAVFNQRIELAGFIALDGTLTDANTRSFSMIAENREEVIGLPFWDTPWWTHDAEQQARVRAAFERAVTGEFIRFETNHLTADGELATVDFSLTPIRGEGGEVQMLFAEGLDVTDHKQAEENWQRSESRAIEAEKLASIGTLTAGIAHDIGAPMTAILGYAEMMQSSLQDEKNKRRAGIIIEQLNRITELVQALLNMARPDEVVRSPVSIASIIDQSIDFYRELFRKRQIEVRREVEPTQPVLGDPNRILQALLNLFVNAADSMESGGTMSVGLRMSSPREVQIQVGDTGSGMPEERLNKIFEPFYTTKARGQGTGLGLLVTKTIVEEHFGTIDVASEVGVGTRFTICLPAVE